MMSLKLTNRVSGLPSLSFKVPAHDEKSFSIGRWTKPSSQGDKLQNIHLFDERILPWLIHRASDEHRTSFGLAYGRSRLSVDRMMGQGKQRKCQGRDREPDHEPSKDCKTGMPPV